VPGGGIEPPQGFGLNTPFRQGSRAYGDSMLPGLTTRGHQHIVEASENPPPFFGSYDQASPLTKPVHLEIAPLSPPLPRGG
jgi:hypothetical protein